MCARFDFNPSVSSDLLQMLSPISGYKTGEVFPTNRIAALTAHGPSVMHWGYPGLGASSRPLVNARSETAAEKPMFAKSLRERRCIIPTTGFYEWGAASGAGKEKHLFLLPDSNVVYLAGLWRESDGEQACVILTTAANSSVRAIHDRMPVILAPDLVESWLQNAQSAYGILHEAPPVLQHRTV